MASFRDNRGTKCRTLLSATVVLTAAGLLSLSSPAGAAANASWNAQTSTSTQLGSQSPTCGSWYRVGTDGLTSDNRVAVGLRTRVCRHSSGITARYVRATLCTRVDTEHDHAEVWVIRNGATIVKNWVYLPQQGKCRGYDAKRAYKGNAYQARVLVHYIGYDRSGRSSTWKYT